MTANKVQAKGTFMVLNHTYTNTYIHTHTHTQGTHSVMQKKYFKWFEDNTAEETRQCLFHRAQMELYKINWHAEKTVSLFLFFSFRQKQAIATRI